MFKFKVSKSQISSFAIFAAQSEQSVDSRLVVGSNGTDVAVLDSNVGRLSQYSDITSYWNVEVFSIHPGAGIFSP